jgi:surface carbohydrate biosynthesis protein
MKKTVVILVDDKKRDLPGSALIAHHLETRLQIKCELQPLESWRACLAAFKPDYILFNHLNASHLAYFSQKLKEMGVLVGVLPNEGIVYDKEALEFNAGKYHSYAHIDQYFCWNEPHGDAVKKHLGLPAGNIHTVGIPRFDFYFEPWRKAFYQPEMDSATAHPRILICTNFGFAKYYDLPRAKVDRHFSLWKDRVSSFKNYWELIEVSIRSRNRVFDFLHTLVAETEYFIDVKPHPRENQAPYKSWLEGLPPADRKRVRLILTETIFEVLPFCDLEISCETCTTALEAWILGKPNIELVFERHPAFFTEAMAVCNRLCDSPEKLPDMIRRELLNPGQEDLQEQRREHLAQWCASPSGTSSLQLAEIIAQALARQDRPRWQLTSQDWRRAGKLKFKGLLGLSYGSNLWRQLQDLVRVKKDLIESKFIRPADVLRWKQKLLEVEAQ